MSEHGTFATEFVWCLACERAIEHVLSRHVSRESKRMHSYTITAEELGTFRRTMFYGEISGLYSGEGIHVFEGQINPELQDVICHPLRVVVMAENGDNMLFSLLPIASLLTQAQNIHSPGKHIPREIHTKDIGLLKEKITEPVRSLGTLLQHDHDSRIVDETLADAMRPEAMFQRPFSHYMMGTRAVHFFAGDISREEPELCLVYNQDGEDWIGQWVEGLGFFDVRFPKASTRDLTEEEKRLYHKRRLVVGNNTPCGGVDLEATE